MVGVQRSSRCLSTRLSGAVRLLFCTKKRKQPVRLCTLCTSRAVDMCRNSVDKHDSIANSRLFARTYVDNYACAFSFARRAASRAFLMAVRSGFVSSHMERAAAPCPTSIGTPFCVSCPWLFASFRKRVSAGV